MLSAEQLCLLRKHKGYKKTKGFVYNWKFSKGIISSPDFNINIDISINGVTYNYLSISQKIFFFLVKRFYISEEIGKYRNSVLEKILESSEGLNCDICSLITLDMKWVAANSQKMEQIKNLTKNFISDPKIKIIFYQIKGLNDQERDKEEREKFYSRLNKKIEIVFNNTIVKLMKKNILESKKDFFIFTKMHKTTIYNSLEEQQYYGNLVSVNRHYKQ